MRISDWSSDVCSSDLAQRLDLGHHRVSGGLHAFPGEAEVRGDLMRDADAQKELARSGARDRARPIIGPGARADDRRIAHPAPALAGDAPGRGDRKSTRLNSSH